MMPNSTGACHDQCLGKLCLQMEAERYKSAILLLYKSTSVYKPFVGEKGHKRGAEIH